VVKIYPSFNRKIACAFGRKSIKTRKFFANFVKFLQKIESFDADFTDFHGFFVVFNQF